jgi:putative ubiquitin-RnfH superfamily antitoxin RatB of RatAB toxin-antitoxin module
MKVIVAYATPQRQVQLPVTLEDGSTVRQAIEKSGVLAMFPDIDLDTQALGIFSKKTTLDAVPEDGSRIEIYRPITADPKTVRRRAQPEKAGEKAEG